VPRELDSVSRFRNIAFLPDETDAGLGSSVRHYPVLTYADVGLATGAPDAKVAEHAREHRAIVMTRNKYDFRLAMQDFAKRSTGGDCQAMHCHEGGGLVTVNEAVTDFNFERVTRKLLLDGMLVEWDDVFFLNLRVHIDPEERVTVSILPLCERCFRSHTPDCARCKELRILELYLNQIATDPKCAPADITKL
jgi:hypothetical protein